MARINLGGYGFRPAPPTPTGRIPASAVVMGDGGFSEKAQQIATRAVLQEQQDAALAERQAQQEEKQRQAELRRAKSVEAYAGFQADVDELTANVTQQIAERALKREDLPGAFDKGIQEIRKRRLEGLDPEQQATVSAHFLTAERGAQAKLRSAVQLDVRQERVASINGAKEQYQRLAVADPANAIRQYSMFIDAEGPGVIGADKVAGEKQSFAENAWASHFTSRIVGARNDSKALAALESEIAGNTALDPDKKSILTGRVMGMRETLAAKAERAQQSRLRTIDREMNAVNTMTMMGYDVPADRLLAISRAAKGTELEPLARQMTAFSAESAKFRAMPPRAQETYLNTLEANIRKNPTPDSIEFVGKLKNIARNQQELVKDDPISFAAQKGLADVKPLDFSQVDTLKDQMLARLDVARGVQGQYGGPLKVLTKEETATLGGFLKRGTADDKAKLLGALKEAIPDRASYNATMQQLAPDSPVTAWAGSLIGKRPYVERNLIRPNVETQAATTAQLMLRGEQMLNPSDKKQDGKGSGFKMPSEKDLLGSFEGQVGEAYRSRPDAFSTALQATKAVYAALSADEGDYSGQMDSSRWKRATELATGGVASVGGAKVVRPYGMNEGEFKDAVFNQFGTLSASGRIGLTKQQLSRLQLENVGDARYVVRSGTGYLLDKSGEPVTIDLTAQSNLPQGLKDAAGKSVAAQVPR